MLWNDKGTLTLPYTHYLFFVFNIYLTLFSSHKATAVLVTTSTDVDKTGASYYGEQVLHYLAINGESAIVQLRELKKIH